MEVKTDKEGHPEAQAPTARTSAQATQKTEVQGHPEASAEKPGAHSQTETKSEADGNPPTKVTDSSQSHAQTIEQAKSNSNSQ